MLLRLDSRLALVWRTPTSLQFGVSSPRLRLDNLDLASERMIAALGAGVSRSGLSVIARSAGVDEAAVDALLWRLRPAMQRASDRAPIRVAIAGTGRLADRVAALLAESGIAVFVTRSVDAAESQDCDLAVAVGHFVLDPGLLGVWLRRDVPHLPVVLGDSAVAVGPFVEPGRSACLYCLQRHATDADPAWTAIATQLWGRRSPADTELVASEVGAVVARAVLARVEGELVSADQLVIGVDGSRTRRAFDIHPDCGCVEPAMANAAANASAAVPRGSGSPADRVPRPTRAAGGGEPG